VIIKVQAFILFQATWSTGLEKSSRVTHTISSVYQHLLRRPDQGEVDLLGRTKRRVRAVAFDFKRLTVLMISQFDCSTPEGAILVLLNGSSRIDFITSFRPFLLTHAREHALSWLEWVYRSLDFASSIYLITGTNKCKN
jgi:hypothetical protein